MKDAQKDLIVKMSRGLNPDIKTTVETTCADYDFFAKHQATRTLSKVILSFFLLSFSSSNSSFRSMAMRMPLSGSPQAKKVPFSPSNFALAPVKKLMTRGTIPLFFTTSLSHTTQPILIHRFWHPHPLRRTLARTRAPLHCPQYLSLWVTFAAPQPPERA